MPLICKFLFPLLLAQVFLFLELPHDTKFLRQLNFPEFGRVVLHDTNILTNLKNLFKIPFIKMKIWCNDRDRCIILIANNFLMITLTMNILVQV